LKWTRIRVGKDAAIIQSREVTAMTQDENRETPETTERVVEGMTEAEIDRTLAETFPASDPPSWTLGTDHGREPPTPPAETPAEDES
jgi:hypothetical protein